MFVMSDVADHDDNDRVDNDDEVMEEDHHNAQQHVTRRWQAPHVKPDSFTGEEDWDQYISFFHH